MDVSSNGANMSDEEPTNAEQRRRFAGMAGKYFQQHGDEAAEDKARDDIGRFLNGWKEAMWERSGIMPRADGSALRADELRVPTLPKMERTQVTQEDALSYLSSAMRADYALGHFENLMRALDAMLLNEDRTELRLHLAAPYVHIRALIEAATTALWILGPENSDDRVTHALRLRYDELTFSHRLAEKYATYAGDDDSLKARDAHVEFVSGQLQDLKTVTEKAGLSFKHVQEGAAPSLVAAEGGAFAPDVGKATAYWYWSTASSIAHGEPNNINMLADMKLVGVDERDAPVAHIDPSAVNVWLHLNVAYELVRAAHKLWNQRAK